VVELRTFPGLAGVAGLVHGVTTRAGGVSAGSYASLNLGRGSGDDAASVAENGRRVAEAVGAAAPPRFPHQVHGAAVVVLEDREGGSPLGEADAVATARPGAAVGVLGADCPGVILVDPVRRALAVVHSGWRGTLAGVVPVAVETLRRRFGSDGKDLRAGIGPGISARRYEVGPEVAEPFRSAFPGADRCISRGRGDRSHLDLHEAIRLQLASAGVPAERVETMAACTYDDSASFFSHRRDGARTGRHALVAMWRP
jgi:YfiH family protein